VKRPRNTSDGANSATTGSQRCERRRRVAITAIALAPRARSSIDMVLVTPRSVVRLDEGKMT
jgi:hypothetical protein